VEYLPLLGIPIIVVGFLLRLNPMLVVVAASLATGLLAGWDFTRVVSALGKAFNDNRLIMIPWVVLPVIGLLERYGLQQRARLLIARMRAATVGRLLLIYLFYRQVISAIGLHSTAGHPQTVRPLVAPMAVAAAERQADLDEAAVERVKAQAAATDNIGLFFGEDVFFAIGSILVIQSTLATYGYQLSPLELAFWAIPTAIAAFLVHGSRLLWMDRALTRHSGPVQPEPVEGASFSSLGTKKDGPSTSSGRAGEGEDGAR
jgi:uncharacterized membrane protein